AVSADLRDGRAHLVGRVPPRSPSGGDLMSTDTRLKGLRWWSELGWRHIVGVVMIVIAVFPLLYALSASVNPAGTLTGSYELFRAVSLENYLELGSTPFLLWMRNSLFVSSVT